jgi:hypothetical protein
MIGDALATVPESDYIKAANEFESDMQLTETSEFTKKSAIYVCGFTWKVC